jgi:glycosyltransferase involved in cell wall biosynthesis
MAAGVPVVSSPQAARGIQAVPGEHLLVAEEARSFVGQVLDVIRNPELRSRLAAQGRQQVLNTHSWSASMKLLDELIETLP